MKSARVLVVEDNPTNLALMSYLLKAFGHEVLMASDGVEALERARADRPDLIVMDVQMPRMDGFEAARALKADARLSAIPVVAVTAFAMVGDRDRILRGGFDGYLPKPITPETFVSDIEAFLPAALEPAAAGPPPTRARILVVDNSPANLQLAESSLRPFGYEVITAGSVDEALDIARQHPPDLILSDLHMPGKNGYDLIRVVKRDDTLRPIPFVFISSTLAGDQDRTLGLSMGAARFIVRPIELDAFIVEIETCLRGRRQDRAE